MTLSITDRLRRTTAALLREGIDALVLTPGADLFYLTGFEHGHAAERLLAFILRADGSASWIAPAMNVPQVEAHALPGHRVRGWNDTEWYDAPLREALGEAKRIAFDDEARSAFVLDLMTAAPHARLVKASSITRSLRTNKDTSELELLRVEGRVVDKTIEQAMSFCQQGRTELEVDERLRAALRRKSPASAVAFTIIASGPNSALPHHETGNRKLRAGDIVILDFGTRGSLNGSPQFGYQSDITVSYSIGEPRDAEAKEVYQIVWEAQQTAISAVRPGVACELIDRAARAVIDQAGYGEFFPHRTGHGIGLQGHEPPYLRDGNTEVLEEGMTFSIEPGIYLPGRFGIRLEVIAACTATGVEFLNAPSRETLPISS